MTLQTNNINSAVGYTVLAWFHHISDLIMQACDGRHLVKRNYEPLKNQKSQTRRSSQIWSKLKGEMAACCIAVHIFQEYHGLVVYFIRVTGNTTVQESILSSSNVCTDSESECIQQKANLSQVQVHAFILLSQHSPRKCWIQLHSDHD